MAEITYCYPPFDVEIGWREDGVLVVAVAGEVDMLTSPRLADAIDSAARRSPVALVVDLSSVCFLGSTAMSLLVGTQHEVGRSIRFVVVADGGSTRRVLRLVGVDRMVTICSTLDDALAHVRGMVGQHD